MPFSGHADSGLHRRHDIKRQRGLFQLADSIPLSVLRVICLASSSLVYSVRLPSSCWLL